MTAVQKESFSMFLACRARVNCTRRALHYDSFKEPPWAPWADCSNGLMILVQRFLCRLLFEGGREKENTVSTDSFMDAVIHLKFLFLFRRRGRSEILPARHSPRRLDASNLRTFWPPPRVLGSLRREATYRSTKYFAKACTMPPTRSADGGKEGEVPFQVQIGRRIEMSLCQNVVQLEFIPNPQSYCIIHRQGLRKP